MSHTITLAFAFFVTKLWPFDYVFMLILCNLHSCTLHNLLTVHGKVDVLNTKMVVPPVLASKLCPFDYFLFKYSCTSHKSVTIWDTLMQLYRNEY